MHSISRKGLKGANSIDFGVVELCRIARRARGFVMRVMICLDSEFQ